jgi:hypothetical protein
LMHNKALGFGSTRTLTRRGVEEAAKRAIELAKASSRILSKGVEMSEEKMGRDRVMGRSFMNMGKKGGGVGTSPARH